MVHSLRASAWVACCLLALARASRLTQDNAIWTPQSSIPPDQVARYGNGVDFNFMTTEFKKPAPADAGMLDKLGHKVGLGRQTWNEQIVEGHTCAKKGEDSQTYYASSMCYWLPDISGSQPGSTGTSGLTWSPGKTDFNVAGGDINLCPTMKGNGECVKCAVCHDNQFPLHKTAWLEKVPLPSSCLKETQIESSCLAEYDVEMKLVLAEIERCHVAQEKLVETVKAVQKSEQDVSEKTENVEVVIFNEVQSQDQEASRLEAEMRGASEDELAARSTVLGQCSDFNSSAGSLPFLTALMNGAGTTQVLEKARFTCAEPMELKKPIEPVPPTAPIGMRAIEMIDAGMLGTQSCNLGLRTANVLRKVVFGKVSPSWLSHAEFVERDGMEFRLEGKESYWGVGRVLYYCPPVGKWRIDGEAQWAKIKAGQCETVVDGVVLNTDGDVLSPKASAAWSVGTAGALLNTVTLGGMPVTASFGSSTFSVLNGVYVERRETKFQVDGRETYWLRDLAFIRYCRKAAMWILTQSTDWPAAPGSCVALASFKANQDILSQSKAMLEQIATGGRWIPATGAGVSSLGSIEQCAFHDKVYAAPASGGWLGTMVFQEPSLQRCQERCADEIECAYVTYLADGACYLQKEGAVLLEPKDSTGLVAAAAHCPLPSPDPTSSSLAYSGTSAAGTLEVKFGQGRTYRKCDWTKERLTMQQKSMDDERMRYDVETLLHKQEMHRHEQSLVPDYLAALKRYQARKVSFERDKVGAESCTKCSVTMGYLQEKSDIHLQSSLVAKDARQNFHDLVVKQARAKEDLEEASRHHAALVAEKAEVEASWLPQVLPCQHAQGNFTAGKSPFVTSCVPRYYAQSCEKACIEAQAANGCAVLEGAQLSATDHHLSAIKAPCSPPQPSWVLASEATRSEQCERLEANQQPRYAQQIIKTGKLMKMSRGGEFQERVFFLESGDSVRSAKLRYSDDEDKESVGKSIALWNVKSIARKVYAQYNDCFKLYGPHQDYRLCVPPSRTSSVEREEWMQVLRSAIA